MDNNFRLLILNKPEGVTSFASLGEVKKVYGKKVGHTGTLDKFASGLMLVLTGGATKLSPCFSHMDKVYRAEIAFGSETDTLDPEGKVIYEAGLPSEENLLKAIEKFKGEIDQTPPLYSAIHVDGKRAYREARRGGEIEMPSRKVMIHYLKLESFDGQKAIIETKVSGGTYIRSLARDIAIEAGSRAHLSALERLSIGPFSKEDVTGIDVSFEKSLELIGRMTSGTAELDANRVKEFQNGKITKTALKGLSADGVYLVRCLSRYLGFISYKGGATSLVAFIR